MRRFKWYLQLGASFLLASALIYGLHYAIFRDSEFIARYFVGQLGFLPISVFLVTVVINKLLSEREKRPMLKKLNMVIGAFFSEMGTPLLKMFAGFDKNAEALSSRLIVGDNWTSAEFASVSAGIASHVFAIEAKAGDLEELRGHLHARRGFLLNLLQNPNLLEHETFSNLLWAIFHLTEELVSRSDMGNLSDLDAHHLSNDIARAYSALVSQWLAYMKHLKSDYPFLFSFAIRTNPFDPCAHTEIG